MGLRGPAPTDIAMLTRNRLWAWLVYACTPGVSSWDALDAHWLLSIDGKPRRGRPDPRGRRRVFQRFFHAGNDPGKLRGATGGLLEAIHADAGQAEAKALYTSKLWELTAPDEPSLERVREIQVECLERLGLIRLTPTERTVAREVGFAHAATQTRDLREIRSHAAAIGSIASVDAIALLGCAYRLAFDSLALQEADAYLDAIRWAIEGFHNRWCCLGAVSGALRGLVEVRLIKRRQEPVPPELLGFRVRYRGAGARPRPIVEWYDMPVRLALEPMWESPIVPLDAELTAFFSNYAGHYKAARASIVDRLEEMDRTSSSEWTIVEPGPEEQARVRAALIDELVLGPMATRAGFGEGSPA